jgi:hypothetical protein
MANGYYANQLLYRRIFVEPDIAGIAMRDDQFAKHRTRLNVTSLAPTANWPTYLGMLLQDNDCGSNLVDMVESCYRIAIKVDIEYLFEIRQRLFGKVDHGILRSFGLCGASPFAR